MLCSYDIRPGDVFSLNIASVLPAPKGSSPPDTQTLSNPPALGTTKGIYCLNCVLYEPSSVFWATTIVKC